MSTAGIDPERWRDLSPRLDELLALPADARPAHLDALRAGDPDLADELAHLLERFEGLDGTDFMATPALAAPAGAAGQRVGAYTLERELGRGGMGSVWLARRTDGRYDGEVAIKFLQSSLFGPVAGERFAREGRILARLDHPHIARLLDAGHLGAAGPGPAQPYLVLEYVAGEPIDDYCEQQRLDVDARLRLFLDVLAAVAHAHNRLILHRDLKPSNILVTDAGQVKLLDFGIAKLLDADNGELTQRAGQAFTPLYAAPEQLQGGDVTTATDVYALGVLLYRLLGGRHPTADATTGGPLHQWQSVIESVPPRISEAVQRAGDRRLARLLRGDLDTIVAKALKKAPAERYANAADLADDLRRMLAHEPIAARPDSVVYRAAKFLRRHRVGVSATALTTLVLAGSAFVAWHEAREAVQQRAQAEGLIEFMLGDLPGKLKPVGRLDALDAVGERALAYYAAQQAGTLDAAALGRRARALHLIGEIDDQRGRLAEAARRFDEAAAATGELLARHPGAPEHLFNHAQSEYWVGFIARRRGLAADAEAAFGRYLALADRLAALEPDQPDWRIEQAYAGQNLGVLRLEAGRPAEALQAFEQTLRAWQRVVDARPSMAFDLANTLGWIAKAHEAANAWQPAIDAQRAKAAALLRLPDADRDREAQYLRANADYEVSRLQLALGQTDAAAASAARSLGLWETLVALDAANLDWLAQLAMARLSLAEAQPPATARAQLAPLQAIEARLRAQPEVKVRWRINLRGRLLALQGRLADGPGGDATAARAALAAWLHEVQAHESAGRPLDAEQARIAAAAGLVLGDLLQRAGRVADAGAARERAAARLQPGVQRQEQPALALAGLLAWQRGDADTARRWADRLATSAYRHPDATALLAALR